MKKVFFVILVIALTAETTLAASATFSWLPNSETDLGGYKIHYGTVCGEFTSIVDVGLPATNDDGRVYGTVEDIPDGETCFAGTAYDTGGHTSGYTEGIRHDPPPGAMQGFGPVVINAESVTININ